MQRSKRVALTFDLDPDYFDPAIAPEKFRSLSWNGVENGVPAILSEIEKLEKKIGQKIPITWFLRADKQIKTGAGRTTFLLENYKTLWDQCRLRGDEFAWHPHLYNLQNNKWSQETNPQKLREDLISTYSEMKQAGWQPQVVRIGESYSDPNVFIVLEELGIKIDSTAMPTRAKKDHEKSFDWSTTSMSPYFPSRKDYRVAGDPAFSILEVPMSMVPVKAPYDKEAYMRYVDLSFYHEMLSPGLGKHLANHDLLVTITHPSTVIPGETHGLLSYSLAEFAKNLRFIVSESEKIGAAVEFIKLGDVPKYYGNE